MLKLNYILNDAYLVSRLIKEFRRDVLKQFFDGDTKKVVDYDYCFTPSYCSKWTRLFNIISILEIFGIEYLDLNKQEMVQEITFLQSPTMISQWDNFNGFLTFIEKCFKNSVYELKTKINLLQGEEEDRLNEALNCHIHGLNYSTIVMSVSAIENRLYSLMQSKCPEAKLDGLTLGQLIGEYTNNKEKYGKVVPRKHESLLDYCNNYRIFSVHPKKEKINSVNATAILCMTCSFLFDKDLKATS